MASGVKRRSTRLSRSRSIYVDPDTDDDFEVSEEEPQQRKPKRRKAAGKDVKKGSSKSARKPWPISAGQKSSCPNDSVFTGPSEGVVPDWASLPFFPLRDIFTYASFPPHDHEAANENAAWLVGTSRVCKSFTLPALEALYRAPPVRTSLDPHSLLALVSRPKEQLLLDYSIKVQRLTINVRRLAYTAHNKSLFDLGTLVAKLPQLQHLEILHPENEPPFRAVAVQSWRYPPSLFHALEEHRLKTFRWNRNMISDASQVYEFINLHHSSRPFQTLQRLTFCGFADESDNMTDDLATAIAPLSNLQDVTFISCEAINGNLLLRLPPTLERLEITNCMELTSSMFRTFLESHGSQLRALVLNHNAALNLEFLPVLKASSPRLEVLKMDLRYYSERLNSNDAEPFYEELLGADAIPTWPSTLQHLELVHLQRFPAQAAQNLFYSLVEAASNLPNFRYLVIQAHINIPWRDRAGFRDQWIERLQRIYLRQSEPPNPYNASKKLMRMYDEAQAAGQTLPTSTINAEPDQPDQPKEDVEVVEVVQPKRRSRRVAKSMRARSTSQSQGIATPQEAQSPSEWSLDEVQGMCETVDIRIDNQRPRETQFTEGDFLDSEVSGDEDWREGNDVSEDEQYAW
ncbi:hypothetical protein K470DRAFT_219680 [Piedraia hortae CBS 480.64]|uniref:RNI-like protein n=1 Tax=Piedraia hortae CBS 480.64 TaxID=1314780 RepID=A0A6A7BVP6_9PEZI|nr:hypothetical protein K470DRAFT_219680 [Piedraia hortae CBS 480.64]